MVYKIRQQQPPPPFWAESSSAAPHRHAICYVGVGVKILG